MQEWVKADLGRFEGHALSVLARQPQSRWLVRLRVTEWWVNTRGGLVGVILRWRLQAAGVKLGYTIPVGTLGRGVRLPHWGTIVVISAARVGENCQILHGVTLAGGAGGAPTVGRDVFLGVNCTLVGPITVNDGAFIAAGAVVISDVPAGETWGGVPAQRIHSPS
jgi:serine O-acetyltransferase